MKPNSVNLSLLILLAATGCGAQAGDDDSTESHWLGRGARPQSNSDPAAVRDEGTSEPEGAQATAAQSPGETLEPDSAQPDADSVSPEPHVTELTAAEPESASAPQPHSAPPVLLDPQSVAPDVAPAAHLQTQWAHQWGSEHEEAVSDLALDAQGNIIAVGYVLVGSDDEGAEDRAQFITKLSATGQVLWDIEEPDRREVDLAYSVAVDSVGESFVAGSVDAKGGQDARLRRYDAEGGLLWENTWDVMGADYVSDVTLDAQGNAFVVGSSAGSGDRDRDAFVTKLDGDGNLLWTQRWGSETLQELASELEVDSEGHLLVAVREGYRVGAIDAVLTKLDAEGNAMWTHRWDGGDHFLADLETDPEGNTFVGGSVGLEGFVAKLDAEGELLWTRYGNSSGFDEVSSIALSAEGELVASAIAYAAGTVRLSRFDVEGELLWSEQVGGDEGVHISSVELAGANIVAAGETGGAFEGTNAGGFDSFVIALSPAP